MRYRYLIGLICFLISYYPCLAQAVSGSDGAAQVTYRKKLAAVDARLAAGWIASSYKVPDRVVEELLFSGYSYGDTLVAMSYMGEGLSLNEVLEERCLQGGARWQDIAQKLGLNTNSLPQPIAELLWFGRNNALPQPIHYLPDPYPGVIKDLVIPAFAPTVPDPEAQQRFRLNKSEVANIRKVLSDPLGVPEKDLRLPAGRGLTAGDWVIAGAISYFKPFPMESLLAARVGENLPWNEVTMAFGLRPDVLTQGPLSGIYPVINGARPGTILIARERDNYPNELELRYDLERLVPSEKRALEPLLWRRFSAKKSEQELLSQRDFEMAEKGLALALTRMSGLNLETILDDYSNSHRWSAIISKYAIDLSGHPEIKQAIALREAL